MRGLKYILLIAFMALCFHLHAQENANGGVEFSGYVKNLQSLIFQKEGNALFDLLLHHRLNMDWEIDSSFKVHAGLRSRVFFGDQLQLVPGYPSLIDKEANDWLDLSLWAAANRDVLFHSYFDRLYLEYAMNDWEIRLGRQRINWGINNYWNPNDLFNVFSFVDFDYEERPGSDAIRIKRYLGIGSSIELASKAADNLDESVAGILYKFNTGSYDIQLLGAWYRSLIAAGGGWAGNIGNAGWKGEMTLFIPSEDTPEHELSLSAGTQVEYFFSNGLYGTAGFLYNSLGQTGGSLASLFNFEIDAQNLYPFRYAVLLSGGKSFTPLLQCSMSVIYSPLRSHPVFLGPSATYSLAQDWDLSFFGQLVFSREAGAYESPVQAFFLRIKWNY